MKLVNPGPGELVDRLTILALKILVGTEKGRPVDHFKTEQATLLTQIRSRTLNGIWFEQTLELAAVNGQLWQTEDALRAARQRHVELVANPAELQELVAVVGIAFKIQKLNDRRAELVTLINCNSGDPAGGAEKL